MSILNGSIDRKALFRVRPAFIVGCVVFIVALLLPDAIARRVLIQRSFLAGASLAVAFGWWLLLRHREFRRGWRGAVTFLTALYLTASIPAFFFELSSFRLLLRHPELSIYLGPWVHWGRILIFLPVVGSVCSRGQARIALVVGSVLLLILWLSMGQWAL